MLNFHRKKIIVITALSAAVFMGIAAHNPEERQDGFKNLKVLPKNISKDSLEMVMDGFKDALGVKCTFCHAPSKDTAVKWPDFASDEKSEKEIARHMMRMTAEINKSWFNFNGSAMPDTIKTVTCNTCHRGEPHPEENEMEEHHDEHEPPPPGNKPGDVNPPPPPNNPTQLIRK